MDEKCVALRNAVASGDGPFGWSIRRDGSLTFQGRLFVHLSGQCREEVLRHFHHSRFTMHPGCTKMYHDFHQQFWWRSMKKTVAEFVTHCLTCQQVKVEHLRSAGKLQPLPVLDWKWDHIIMDLVTGLPKSSRKHDVVWVIVDRLTKSARFIGIKTTDSLETLSQIYLMDIVRLHGVPKSIVSDRDRRFVSLF